MTSQNSATHAAAEPTAGSKWDVSFSLTRTIERPAQAVWDALCDWRGHAAWVPLTSVDLLPADTDTGAEKFVAYTGIKPLRLEDNMRVLSRDDDAMRCVVEKTGPVLLGTAEFRVRALSDASCEVTWIEHVRLARGARALRRLAAFTSAPARAGFAFALRRLERTL